MFNFGTLAYVVKWKYQVEFIILNYIVILDGAWQLNWIQFEIWVWYVTNSIRMKYIPLYYQFS